MIKQRLPVGDGWRNGWSGEKDTKNGIFNSIASEVQWPSACWYWPAGCRCTVNWRIESCIWVKSDRRDLFNENLQVTVENAASLICLSYVSLNCFQKNRIFATFCPHHLSKKEAGIYKWEGKYGIQQFRIYISVSSAIFDDLLHNPMQLEEFLAFCGKPWLLFLWGQGYPFLFCSPGPFYSGQLQNRAFDRTAEAGDDAEEVAGLRYNL